MEEVEALCDRIGILHLGRLQCLGDITTLKNKYGQGYRLSLSTNNLDKDEGRLQNIIEQVKEKGG